MDGKKLLPYREQLGKILQRTLHLTCKQGYILSCNLLHHLLRSATLIYPTEYCSVPGGFDKPLSEYFPIKARILIYLGLEDLTLFFKKQSYTILFGFICRFLNIGSSNGKCNWKMLWALKHRANYKLLKIILIAKNEYWFFLRSFIAWHISVLWRVFYNDCMTTVR